MSHRVAQASSCYGAANAATESSEETVPVSATCADTRTIASRTTAPNAHRRFIKNRGPFSYGSITPLQIRVGGGGGNPPISRSRIQQRISPLSFLRVDKRDPPHSNCLARPSRHYRTRAACLWLADRAVPKGTSSRALTKPLQTDLTPA